jgi:hypothetical protein
MNLDWRALAKLPEAALARLDVAEVDLICADGLPGSSRIDRSGCLRTLDTWTDCVRNWTAAAEVEYWQPDPASFDHSEPLFRMVSLVTALKQHCGVRYDPKAAGKGPGDPFEFDEQFIHGAIQGDGGTCATLPLVFAAVGRRLGYPVKVVNNQRHVFCRWDDPATGTRVNVEGSSGGVDSYPDDHYRSWPEPMSSAADERAYGWLTSWTPRRELANAIGQRGYVWKDHGEHHRAVECFLVAAEVDAGHATYPRAATIAIARWQDDLRRRCPAGFPHEIRVNLNREKRRWPTVPWEIERHVAGIHTTEWCLRHPTHEQQWWHPLRQGRRPLSDVPTTITVDYELVLQTEEG